MDTRRKAVQGIAARGFPLLKPNRAMEFPGMYQCDKIFSAWYGDRGEKGGIKKDVRGDEREDLEVQERNRAKEACY